MYCESNEVGVGVDVRNSLGEVKAALAEKIMKPPIVEALELLVARRTALFSEKALGGHLIQDILCIVNSFVSTSFSHVGRKGNIVAHALA
ncbi:hypothetical protein CFP56_012649 [Quercus suber]|uniref:RNase H type-1 domain-containing protein n=1 Tax=Quercus suber TaxID=58331 RepID=A0AAW0KWR9_QUESU